MTISSGTSASSPRFFIFSLQRTTSNLLVRILGLHQQPNIHWSYDGSCIFLQTRLRMRSLGLSDRSVSHWNPEEKAQVQASFQESFNALEEYVVQGEAKGKVVFAKEHCNFLDDPSFNQNTARFTVQLPERYGSGAVSMGNPTVLPDVFLRSWTPVFLIRHPARIFPSLCRALMNIHRVQLSNGDMDYFLHDLQQQMSLTTRRLYDWYAEQLPGPILLLDSDDVINDSGVVEQLARQIGLDVTKMQRSWKPAEQSEMAEASSSDQVFMQTIMTSSGIQKDKAAGQINLMEESLKWRAEFGDAIGALVELCVKEAMPDYNYLRSKRLMDA